MNEKPPPRHLTRYVEEVVECGVQLATMLDQMYRFREEQPNADPSIPSPPEVLRDLVAKTLEPELARRKRDLHMATGLLMTTGKIIERDIFLVDPSFFDDEMEPLPGLNGSPPDERLH